MNCCGERSGVYFLHSDRFISGTVKASISRIATIRKPEELVTNNIPQGSLLYLYFYVPPNPIRIKRPPASGNIRKTLKP